MAAVDEEVRSYRVSRVHHVTVMETTCIRPAGFNLAEYWQRSLVEFKATLPRYAVMLRVAPKALPLLRYAGYLAHIEQIDPPDAEGWSPVSIRFDVRPYRFPLSPVL